MMKVLVDIDAIKHYLTGVKDDQSEALNQIATMCSNHEIEGFIAFHSLNVIWYFARKNESEATGRKWLQCICDVLTVSSADNEAVAEAAHNREFRDFEDNLQDCCAVSSGCDYIVTVNTKDYEHSRTKAVTPAELVQLLTPTLSGTHNSPQA